MFKKILSSIHALFNHKIIRSYLLKFRFLIWLVFIFLMLPLIKPSMLLPGLITAFFGELIQLWCFASLDKNANLAENGPYCLVRNPMYLGRYFLILGGVILFGSIIAVIIYTVLYYFYMVNRVKREEAKLRVIFGADYEEYCSRVNRFLPKLTVGPGNSLLYFRWKLLLQNHGHWNFIGLALACLVCIVYTYFKTSN